MNSYWGRTSGHLGYYGRYWFQVDQVIMNKAPPYICCFLTTLRCKWFVFKMSILGGCLFWNPSGKSQVGREVPPVLTGGRITLFCWYLILLWRRMLNFIGNISLFNTTFQRTSTIIISLIPVSNEKQLALQNVFHETPKSSQIQTVCQRRIVNIHNDILFLDTSEKNTIQTL